MDEGSGDTGEPMPTAYGSAAAAELRRQQAAAELVAEAPLAEERRDNAMRLKDAGNAAVREVPSAHCPWPLQSWLPEAASTFLPFGA
jgi:hypothetical protein